LLAYTVKSLHVNVGMETVAEPGGGNRLKNLTELSGDGQTVWTRSTDILVHFVNILLCEIFVLL
jgi:hypothetical protein